MDALNGETDARTERISSSAISEDEKCKTSAICNEIEIMY